MKVTRNILCLLLLLCLAAGLLTGCLAVRSEEPEGSLPLEEPESALPLEDSSAASEPPAPTRPFTDPLPEAETREALVRSLAGEMDRDGGSGAFTVCGEVGAYTLCYIPHGGDTAVVEDVFAGYRIFSPTVGYPSATHLYLVGDDAIYTLRAAYMQGLIADMGALYALLPAEMQAGYDLDAEDSFSGDTDWFGFADGVYRGE